MARQRTPKECKKCRQSGLFWKSFNGSWRLATPEGLLHVCHGDPVDLDAAKAAAADNPYAEDAAGEPIPHPDYDPNAPKGSEAGRSIWQLVKPYAERDFQPKQAAAPAAAVEQSVIVINDPMNADDPKVVIEGAHKQTADVIRYLGMGLHTLAVGPAGSGKTLAAEHAAEALGLKFYPQSVGSQTSKTDLLGYMQPQLNGPAIPVRTILREAYEHGGLFLLDEMDAGNANVLTILNASLANGYCSFPDGVIKQHADFRVMAAGNTYGNGANRQYVGRNQLDAATMDRFVVVDWDYDTAIEAQIQQAFGITGWAEYIWQLRKAQQATGTRVILSTRAIVKGCKLLKAGTPRDTVEQLALWAPVAADDKAKLQAAAGRI